MRASARIHSFAEKAPPISGLSALARSSSSPGQTRAPLPAHGSLLYSLGCQGTWESRMHHHTAPASRKGHTFHKRRSQHRIPQNQVRRSHTLPHFAIALVLRVTWWPCGSWSDGVAPPRTQGGIPVQSSKSRDSSARGSGTVVAAASKHASGQRQTPSAQVSERNSDLV